MALALISFVLLGCDAERVVNLLDRPEGLGGEGNAQASGGSESGGTSNDLSHSGGAVQDVTTPITLIDDFADCDSEILSTAGRSGSWYHFASPAVYLVNVTYTVGVAPDETWGTQSCGIYLTGGCPLCDAAGVGFQLAPDAWDLSAYTGLRVSFESETSLWAVVVSKDGDASGYTEYVELTATGAISAERELIFAEMLPGTGFQGFAQAREIQFTIGSEDRDSFGLGIHRVELF